MMFRRTFTFAVALAFAIAAAGNACEDCWPAYYEALYFKPSNWLTVGQYDAANDVVWTRTEIVNQQFRTTRWYVMPGGDPDAFTAPTCCPVGPHYISSDGSSLLLYP